ncbi:MAG: alpha/beta fold hydrolase [Nitrospinota bacterium]|nr:alpha/beta fold hydrolase [Nitrospinota bacterium]MDH5677052.1 alpha/beta fold hydrolase [Nitrospinota bacterium]MDH5755053.1 alpha/beta fold hydrolase [Nitrospinota bacterium]
MITVVLVVTGLLLAALGLFLLFLYTIRWYDLSINRFDPAFSMTKTVTRQFWRPVRSFVAEYVYCVANGFFLLAGGALRLSGRRSSIPSGASAVKGAPLVVLIHGLMSTGANMWVMKQRLRFRGIRNIAIYDYPSTRGSLEEKRDKLRDFIVAAHEATGAQGVALIGHSMGGVIAHDYACEYGTERGGVVALVTTGAPLRGSRLAALGLSSAGRALHPQNPYFTRTSSRRPQAPFFCIGAVYDELVIPYTNSSHPLADSFEVVDICGHAGLLYSSSSFALVMQALRAALPDEAGEETGPVPDRLSGEVESGKI